MKVPNITLLNFGNESYYRLHASSEGAEPRRLSAFIARTDKEVTYKEVQIDLGLWPSKCMFKEGL